jgi:excisionase family DNA binding protein
MHSPTLLLNSLQAAKALAISPRTLWSLTRSGQIAHVRIGRRIIRYQLSDLEAFLQDHVIGGQSND